MVSALAEKLGLSAAPFPVALAGGVLLNSPLLLGLLQNGLLSQGLQASPFATVADPVLGAVKLARQRADRDAAGD
jgi:hypothetical protein